MNHEHFILCRNLKCAISIFMSFENPVYRIYKFLKFYVEKCTGENANLTFLIYKFSYICIFALSNFI